MSPSVSQMGRHASRNSVSPGRGGASPRKRSPSRRVRPPDSSPVRRSPTRRERSPRRRSPSHREKSPSHHKSSRRSNSPRRDKQLNREKSVIHKRSSSPVSRSPSPRTKRLSRAQAEREAERKTERDHVKGSERTKNRERERDDVRDDLRDKRARKLGRHGDGGSDGLRHRRSSSPSDHHRYLHQSGSPPSHSRARDEDPNARGADRREDDDDSLLKMKAAQEELDSKKKQEPSFAYSGKLAEETNRVRGITLLFNEPPDARKPTVRWRLYVFKGGEVLNEPLYVHRNSCYLFGRERRIADIPTDHPSCSKQHAVLQYRHVEKELPDGTIKKEVRPYVMDLGSTNKTFLNDNPIEPQRYYELFEKDVIKFGNSSREYVLLHEHSVT